MSWRARYMAIWRGNATALVRFLARRSWSLTPKTSATRRWMCSMVMSFSSSPQMLGQHFLGEVEAHLAAGEAQKAIMRASEPSSSRMLDFTRLAMK